MQSNLTKKQIKMLTGVTSTELELWIRNGLKEHETSPGKFDGRGFYVWYRDEIYRPKLKDTVIDGDEVHLDVAMYKAKYEKARAAKYVIRLNKLREKYVTKNQTSHTLYEIADVLGNMLEKLPTDLAEICTGNDEATMLMGIDKYVRRELLKYSKLGER